MSAIAARQTSGSNELKFFREPFGSPGVTSAKQIDILFFKNQIFVFKNLIFFFKNQIFFFKNLSKFDLSKIPRATPGTTASEL